jgi:hypothetical protein
MSDLPLIKVRRALIFLTSLARLSSWANGSSPPSEALRPASYEIGSVGSEDRVLGKFVLRNPGDGALVLRNVRRNCACYRIAHSVKRLEPGESMTFTFDLTFPKGKRLHNAVFYILSNDREKPLRLFTVKLEQSDDPDFAASEADQVILQPLDENLADMGALEGINEEDRRRRHRDSSAA